MIHKWIQLLLEAGILIILLNEINFKFVINYDIQLTIKIPNNSTYPLMCFKIIKAIIIE